jgi:hypothetical protein
MKKVHSKASRDRQEPVGGKDDSIGTGGHEYKLEVNGVRVVVSSEAGMVTARELLKIAEKAQALVTVLDAKTVLADDDRMYEGDDEVTLEDARTFIAVSKYEGTDSVLERIQHLLPGESAYGRRRL